ncbi:hypothetical protein BH10PSE7_BH10PSE7_09340 [soil metagenome]
MTEFAPSIQLALAGLVITGKPGVTIGGAVSSAGDLNGDGLADVIIGADRADPNGTESGATYVVFGKSSGFAGSIGLAQINGANGFEIKGEVAGDRSGNAVSSAGDVNGDGIDDIIIGAPVAGPNGSASGASYVVFGKQSGFAASLNLAGLNGTNGFQIRGESAGDFAGRSVSGAGDINGDGFDDLIVGAPSASAGGGGSGSSYVVFGKAAGFAANVNLATLSGAAGFEIRGEAAGDNSGYSVSGPGDINGDGFDDLVIGASGAHLNDHGATYVVFGKAQAFPATFQLSALNGANGFEIRGETANDASGFSVSGAGDVNGDGLADLIVGAHRANPHGEDSGASYVVFGRSTGFSGNVNLSALNGVTGFEIRGETGGDYSGFSVGRAGDVNGDGFDDLIVGAPTAGPAGGGSGATYVVFGKATSFSPNFDLSTLNGNNGFEIVGIAGTLSGMSVSGAGDVNGDGFDDLIVGAPSGDGRAYIVLGHRAHTAVVRIGTNISQDINGGLGNDRLDGFRGFDTLIGWEGNDVYTLADLTDLNGTSAGGLAFDVVEEFAQGGTDTVRVASLDNQSGGDGYRLTPHVEHAIVTGGRDFFVRGNDEGNVLIGNVANNTLWGFANDDRLFGRFGDDVLIGGMGQDGLIGGGERDRFVFNTLAESGPTFSTRDVIVDFSHLADVIDLSGIDARPGGADQAFTFRGVAAFSAVGQVRLQQSGSDTTIVQLNTIIGSSPEATIELNGVTASTLTAADFLL